MSEVISAAGAVIWRKHKDNFTEVAIIHRPKPDDWSFPKGKLELGESLIACAYREVFEETNLQTEFGPLLGQVEYFTPEGLKKLHIGVQNLLAKNHFVPIPKLIN